MTNLNYNINYVDKLPFKIKTPRKMLLINDQIWICSYLGNCINIYNSHFNLLKQIKTKNLYRPRGIYYYRKRIYISCYGNPKGKIICISLKDLTEKFYFECYRPRGLIIINNKIYVTEVNKNRIAIFSLKGQIINYIESKLIKKPRGICFNKQKKHLIVANSGDNSLIIFNLEGHFKNLLKGFYNSNDVIYYKNMVLVTEWYTNCLKVYDLNKKKLMLNIPINVYNSGGNIAMLNILNDQILISDNTLNIIHLLQIKKKKYNY